MVEAPPIDRLLADPEGGQAWGFFFPPDPAPDEAEDTDAAGLLDARTITAEASQRQPRADEIVVTEPNPRRIARLLENLARRSNAEFEDKALRILYLAAGFLD